MPSNLIGPRCVLRANGSGSPAENPMGLCRWLFAVQYYFEHINMKDVHKDWFENWKQNDNKKCDFISSVAIISYNANVEKHQRSESHASHLWCLKLEGRLCGGCRGSGYNVTVNTTPTCDKSGCLHDVWPRLEVASCRGVGLGKSWLSAMKNLLWGKQRGALFSPEGWYKEGFQSGVPVASPCMVTYNEFKYPLLVTSWKLI